jgi:hypothetical protein
MFFEFETVLPVYSQICLELVLSDLCSTFDGVDLCSNDALLPMELLRRWSAQLCHVVLCLHSRGVIIQVSALCVYKIKADARRYQFLVCLKYWFLMLINDVHFWYIIKYIILVIVKSWS